MLRFKCLSIILPLVAIASLHTDAQANTDQKKEDKYSQLQSLINSKKYRFHALSATSMRGRTIQLTSEYSIELNNDTLNVNLPYFGRSYSSDYLATDLSISFSSTQFDYNTDSSKKSGWEITIKPKNEPKANRIDMFVTTSGYCTVQVSSNSRQPISFYGTFESFHNK
jgi:hypothetical protein